ncbi:MAG: hypothetical protein CBD18_02385 [Opitutales bacterium TMED158]|nr:MAG: hypothetical protein CBD18_02385 [Opitutales bacterium TMED158]
MKLIELVLDEDEQVFGVDAISLVDEPAIERDFVALQKQQVRFKQSGERQVLMGPALIPDKFIYRRDDDRGEYSVYFSKSTVRRASELYLRRNLANSFTKDHESKVSGIHLTESWIVESDTDKSRQYGFDVPIGTWMVAVKVDDTTLWAEAVKTGKVRGFSIEGYFVNKMREQNEQSAMREVREMVEKIVN